MERNYIGINAVNIITIGIMAFVGMAVLGFAGSFVRQKILT